MSEAITKAAEMALEALASMTTGNERDSDGQWGRICMPKNDALNKAHEAAQALRAALSQAGQGGQGEVVADVPIHPRQGPLWANVRPRGSDTPVPSYPMRPLAYADAAQPAPVASVAPMTDEDVEEIEQAIWPGILLDSTDRAVNRQFVQAVEAHHRIAQQPDPAVPAVPLVRDLAELLDLDVPEVCKIMAGLGFGQRSTNMEVSLDEMLAVKKHVALSVAPNPAGKEPAWIVNDLGELGVMVGGRCFFLYKGDNIEYGVDGIGESRAGIALHEDGTPMRYRPVGKREFGETCKPLEWVMQGQYSDRYTTELVFTPGLSHGKPDDCKWRDLPAKQEGAAP